MTADNPAARVDLDALEPEERASLLRVLDWGVESRNMPHATALHVLAIADRLAPLLAERDEARAERDRLRGLYIATLAELTDAQEELSALRERVEAVLGRWERDDPAPALVRGFGNQIRSVLADPEAS